jgi:hypothetical protein
VHPSAILRYWKTVEDVHRLSGLTLCLEVMMSLRTEAIRFVLQQEIHYLLLPRVAHENPLLLPGLRFDRLIDSI